jgi:hypothetical protein
MPRRSEAQSQGVHCSWQSTECEILGPMLSALWGGQHSDRYASSLYMILSISLN